MQFLITLWKAPSDVIDRTLDVADSDDIIYIYFAYRVEITCIYAELEPKSWRAHFCSLASVDVSFSNCKSRRLLLHGPVFAWSVSPLHCILYNCQLFCFHLSCVFLQGFSQSELHLRQHWRKRERESWIFMKWYLHSECHYVLTISSYRTNKALWAELNLIGRGGKEVWRQGVRAGYGTSAEVLLCFNNTLTYQTHKSHSNGNQSLTYSVWRRKREQ